MLTGFPGFIGRRVVARLLEVDDEVAVTALVESRMADTARELGARFGDRLEIVEGDIGERHLGLSDADWDRLTGSVDMVFHLAAIYDLAVPLALAQRVNVDGTGNVIDFCRAAANLRRHVYVSTAYVAGDRKGTVYEHELVLGQDFKNHYESTKFQAEVWVRESMAHVPTTILRPAIVVGDSQTGETEKFDGPYYLLRAVSQAAHFGRAPVQFGHAEAPFNVVPVDFVVAGMVAAATDEAMVGETLHLVDPDPLSAHELLEALGQEYGARPPRGQDPAGGGGQGAARAPGAQAVQQHAQRVDRLPQPPRHLRHPARGGAAGPARPAPAQASATTWGRWSSFFKEHEEDPSYEPKH